MYVGMGCRTNIGNGVHEGKKDRRRDGNAIRFHPILKSNEVVKKKIMKRINGGVYVMSYHVKMGNSGWQTQPFELHLG